MATNSERLCFILRFEEPTVGEDDSTANVVLDRPFAQFEHPAWCPKFDASVGTKTETRVRREASDEDKEQRIFLAGTRTRTALAREVVDIDAMLGTKTTTETRREDQDSDPQQKSLQVIPRVSA